MLFWACLLILIGLVGLAVTGILLVMQISEAMNDLDGETWHR